MGLGVLLPCPRLLSIVLLPSFLPSHAYFFVFICPFPVIFLGLLPYGPDVQCNASTEKRPVRQASHRVVLRTDSDAVVASNNATTILVQGNTVNNKGATNSSALNNGGIKNSLNIGRNGGTPQNDKEQNQCPLSGFVLRPTSGCSNEVIHRERQVDKVSISLRTYVT